jgi:hypothetical protein
VTWTVEQLTRIDAATELELAPRQGDGTLRTFTTMWVVRVGHDLYVRSAGGPNRSWYRHALASGAGRIRAGGIKADVAFDHPTSSAPQDAIDAAYRTKYDGYGPRSVAHVTGPEAHPLTIRLVRSEP